MIYLRWIKYKRGRLWKLQLFIQVTIFRIVSFGGSQEYCKTLFERIQKHVNSTNQVLDYFYCQEKCESKLGIDMSKWLQNI